jgi:tetratricopeptide (TPR) repeat protein
MLAPDHPVRLRMESNLASAYSAMGKLDKGLPLYEQILAKRKAKLGADHPDTLHTMRNLATAHSQAGNLAKAVGLQEQALAKQVAKLGPEHPDTLDSMDNLGTLYSRAGQISKALLLLDKTLTKEKAKLGPDNSLTLRTMYNLAELLANCEELHLRDPAQAVELMTKATKTTNMPHKGHCLEMLGVARYRAGDWQGSLDALKQSMQLLKGGDSAVWFFAAMAHCRLGDKEQSRKWYDRAVRWMEKHRPKDKELRRFRAEAAALLGVKETANGPNNDVSPRNK